MANLPKEPSVFINSLAALASAIVVMCACVPYDSSKTRSDDPTLARNDANPNLAANVSIKRVDGTWAPPRSSKGSPNILWLGISIENRGNKPIREVWANIRFWDSSGRELEEVKDEIIYYSIDLQDRPLGPGSIYEEAATDELAEPYFPERDYQPIRDEAIRFEVKVTRAYEELTKPDDF